ncbi:MAG: ABC transporter permease, partial [Planctomycetota bacterium]
MTPWFFIRRSLFHYRRRHAAVVLGVAVAVAVLTGALVTGDSVRESLKNISRVRLGKVRYALASGDHFFRGALAHEIGTALDIPCTAVLQVEGTARSEDGSKRIPRVQVLGVDPEFWSFGLEPLQGGGPETGEAVIDLRVARELGVKPGDEILLRVRKPQAMPAEVSFSTVGKGTWTERVKVRAVVRDEQMGRFSLRVSQLPSFSVFLSREWFSDKVDPLNWVLPGRPGPAGKANILIAGSQKGDSPDVKTMQDALRTNWTLWDGGQYFRFWPDNPLSPPGGILLQSKRVFLGRPIEEAAYSVRKEAQRILTYFVNSLRSEERSTPYSFVSAMDPMEVPIEKGDREIVLKEMDDTEILLNDWLAKDLDAKPGDRVELTYFVFGPYRQLEEKSSTFTVRGIVPLNS